MFSPSARLLFVLSFVSLLGAGCFGGSSGPTGPDGGVWKTKDHGQTWVNKRVLVTGPKLSAGAAEFAVLHMAFDPQDNNTVYAATAANGLVYSLDAGDSWQQLTTLKATRVNTVAVDPKNKCLVYVGVRNEIWKTDNCGRDWFRLFFDARTDKTFSRIAIDWYNPLNIYAGTSDGDVLKSVDAGASWLQTTRVEGTPITEIVIDPHDSRIVYVGTRGDGIWKTTDTGANWAQIKKQFGEEFSDARRVIQLVVDPRALNTLFVVSKFGIIRSEDGGQTWKALNLTAPPGSITITAMAIDPNDSKKLVYTGPTTMTYSVDAGVTWTAKKLPTTRGGSSLLIDPKDGNIVYLGTIPVEK